MHPEKRPPARGERLDLRVHVRLVRELVSLAGVAAEARSDDVVPSRATAFVPRSHVIEIQLGFRQRFHAVLAGELVSQENIAARELHFQAGKTIIDRQDHDLWNPERDSRTMDHFHIRTFPRITDPRGQIVAIESFLTLHLHDLRVTEAEQME